MQSITDYMFGDFWEFLLAKMFIYLPMFDICVGHSSTSNVLQKKVISSVTKHIGFFEVQTEYYLYAMRL